MLRYILAVLIVVVATPAQFAAAQDCRYHIDDFTGQESVSCAPVDIREETTVISGEELDLGVTERVTSNFEYKENSVRLYISMYRTDELLLQDKYVSFLRIDGDVYERSAEGSWVQPYGYQEEIFRYHFPVELGVVQHVAIATEELRVRIGLHTFDLFDSEVREQANFVVDALY